MQEWMTIYDRLNRSNRRWLTRMMRRRIWTRRYYLPRPMKLSLFTATISFALLCIMPVHPMAIPAAFGGGLSFALILA